MGRRIGLLGGTFDPPHLGHLWLAETARSQLQLDAVLFLPVGRPPHKKNRPVTATAHRLVMTRLAIADAPHFLLDQTDIDRPPPHATYTLLPLIREAYPDTRLWLLIGEDSLRDFPTWQQPAAIITHCRLAVLPRPGNYTDLAAVETAVPGVSAAVDWLDGPTLPISSRHLREWARRGRSIRYLVPATVLKYITAQGLYRDKEHRR
ncbi:MAG: nicotinate-nucleotide adenylyltransferase [Anaerolineae bacterium]